jgi:hypothetical protein
MKELTFVCWKWDSSAYPHARKKHRDYTYKHVNILYAMLYRNLSVPFRLFCVTDDPTGIRSEVKTVPLWGDFRTLGGCFLRLKVFEKGFDLFGDKFVSIDLDCVILKDITSLFLRDEDFVIWAPRKKVRWLPDREKGAYYCGSMWMLKAGTRPEVYSKFNPNDWHLGVGNRYDGGTDQKHLSQMLYPNEATWTVDDGVCLFVEDIMRSPRGQQPISSPRIVFFNGIFLPDDVACKRLGWVRAHYHESLESGENKDAPPTFPEIDRNGTISIISFYWDRWPDSKGDPMLGISYINKLFSGIAKYIPKDQEYEFILFTDDMSVQKKILEGIFVRELDVPPKLAWNLKKMFMFSRQSGLCRPTICFDLDSIITGDLSPLIDKTRALLNEPARQIICCEDAYRVNTAGGAIVGFIPSEKLEHILWDPITIDRKKVEAITRGSERFWYRYKYKNNELKLFFWERLIPGKVLSYKKDCLTVDNQPELVRVVRFHGRPRPHQVRHGWMKELLSNEWD